MPSVVKLKNPKVMTFPSPFRCSQKLSRLDSVHSRNNIQPGQRCGGASVFVLRFLAPIRQSCCNFHWRHAARKTNRMIMRAPPSKQMENHILIRQLSRPIIAREFEIIDVDESTHVAPHAHQDGGNKANVPGQQRR